MGSYTLRTPSKKTDRRDERGLAMLTVLGMILIVTLIGVSFIGLMVIDMLHASVQNTVARSFYIAQAGLEEARGRVAAAVDPVNFTTAEAGVTSGYGGGQFTYWVDAGPATGCGDGFKTLVALGEVRLLSRTIPARVRACGVPGTPISTALFGTSRLEFQGAARTYIAPYVTGTPGGGGSLGSFTEVHFADTAARLNALSEDFDDTVTLRDVGAIPDYALFGFSTRPAYDPDPATSPSPWVLGVFGDLIKAQPKDGLIPNACGTPYACVTGPYSHADIQDVGTLRSTVVSGARDANLMRHVYLNRLRQAVLPQLSLDPAAFEDRAARNHANADINRNAGFVGKRDSVYLPAQFFQIVVYLTAHPEESLQGTIFVAGTLAFWQSVNLGGNAGNVTLAVRGDLVLGTDVPLMFPGSDTATLVVNRHDLSTAAGRRTPGILVFGTPTPTRRSMQVCGETVNGSGRLVLCGMSKLRLVADGLIYTADGMVIQSGAYLDQVGAMYHGNRGTTNPSFLNQNATVVLRFDPLALSAFGSGISILSWQQLLGAGEAVPAPPSPDATVPIPSAPTAAMPLGAPEPPTAAVPHPAPGPPAAPSPLPEPQRPNPEAGSGPRPIAPAPLARMPQTARPTPPPVGQPGGPQFHVQAGAFRTHWYADDLTQQLRAHGYTVVRVEGPLIRVWVGSLMNRGDAERVAENLRSNGFEAVLSPAR